VEKQLCYTLNHAFKYVVLKTTYLKQLKMTVFWAVPPSSLVEVYHHQGALVMEAASTSETSVNFYQTRRRNNTEVSHIHTRRHENLKYHL
jgi:hypothetical protein